MQAINHQMYNFVIMPMRTTIVISGDNDHTVETSSRGFRMDDHVAMLRMRLEGNCVLAAATHDLEKKDRTSAVPS